jgi:ATP-binding cassette, subfamily C, bacteriocin exporter
LSGRGRAVPKVQQHGVTDCGAACLVAVARYHGLPTTLSTVRHMAATDRGGTTVYGLMRAAERIGLSARAVRATLEAMQTVPLPAIAHTTNERGLHHYVVAVRVERDVVRVMDPAGGEYRRLSTAEFARIWSGVLVLLRPAGDLRAGPPPTSLWRRLHAVIHPHRSAVTQALAGSAVYTALGLSSAVFLQKIVDHVLISGNRNLLNLITLAMLIALGFQVAIGLRKDLVILKTGQRVDAALILGYHRHLLRLPQSFFDRVRTGEITSRLNDSVKIRAFVNDVLIALVINLLVIAGSLALMFVYSWRLALLVLLFLPVQGALYWFSDRRNRVSQRRLMEAAAEVESQFIENVDAIDVIRSHESAEIAHLKVEASVVRLLRAILRSGRILVVGRNVADAVSRLFVILVLWQGAGMVIDNMLTPGQLMSFYALVGYMTGPVGALIGMNRLIRDAWIAGERLLELMDLEPEPEAHGTRWADVPIGEIRFEGVTFRYGARAPVLVGIDLTIARGSLTAIVGASGSGKSTIGGLIHKIHHPESGRILVGERDLKNVDTASVRRHVALVPQTPRLIVGSVLENIAVGEPEPDVGRVLEICGELDIVEFVERLPQGFATIVGGAGGGGLSGGERQKIAIARALYRRPDVLILDEATASLDPRAESKVREVISGRRAEGMTVLVIAHRSSAVEHADEVIHLERGRVRCRGGHAGLLARDTGYAEFWRYARAG